MGDKEIESIEITELVPDWRYVMLALALGVAVTIAAAVILARVGEDHHADE